MKLRSILGKALIVGVLVSALAAPHAQARVFEGPTGSVEGSVVDVWAIAGDTITAVMGPRTCSITASTPVNSANTVAGSGSVSCNRPWSKLTLTVCVQAKQAFLAEQTSWEDAGCAPPKAALNSSGLNGSAQAQCRPGPWLYRTKVTAEGQRADSNEPVFTAMITSDAALYDCFL